MQGMRETEKNDGFFNFQNVRDVALVTESDCTGIIILQAETGFKFEKSSLAGGSPIDGSIRQF